MEIIKSNIELSILLGKIREEGVRIFLEDEKLKIKKAKGHNLDQKLLAEIKNNKNEIIDYLKNETSRGAIDKSSQNPYSNVILEDQIPVSFSQERLWFEDQLNGGETYNITTLLKLEGDLNKDFVGYSFNELVNRHKILRTVYKESENGIYQYPIEENIWELSYEEASTETSSFKEVERLVEKMVLKPFDLSKEHVFRVALIKINSNCHYLAIVIHHIAFDGWSMSILIDEFINIYKSKIEDSNPTLKKLPIDYYHYSVLQRENFQKGYFSKKMDYWKEKLSGFESLDLPTDFVRPNRLSGKGGFLNFVVSRKLTGDINVLAKACNVSSFTMLVAAFKVLLYRYSGQKDICIGTPMANRLEPELQTMIGFFANTIPLRTILDEKMTFVELLVDIKDTTVEAYSNQDVPFNKILEATIDQRDLGQNPLFNVMFVLQNNKTTDSSLGTIKIESEQLERNTSTFDLTFSLSESTDGLSLAIEYSSDIYKKETVERMFNHYHQLLKSINHDPNEQIGKLKIIDVKEESKILFDFNHIKEKRKHQKNVIDLFEEQVKISPNNIAVTSENQSLSFKELDEITSRLANYLINIGIEKDMLVALCLNRSSEMIIGMLGILKAGAAYVPIDTKEYPIERIEYVLKDTNAKIILTNETSFDSLPKGDSDLSIFKIDTDVKKLDKYSIDRPAINITPNNLMYVIYTSGTTGKPKGVLLEHKGIVNLVLEHREILKFRNNYSVLQFASISFDASCFEIYNTILNGARLVVLPKEKLINPISFEQALKKYEIDVVIIHPSYQEIVKDKLDGVKILISGGEPLNPLVAKEITDQNIRLFNSYGPTENTVCITIADKPVRPNGKVTIGKPVNNVEVYILDSEMNPVPIGVEGELCVSGTQLGRGYRNLEELTAEKFINNKFNPSSKLYRTGDVAKWLPDGNIELLGRRDDQIKIRGYRVELSEIETVIENSGYVEQCTVLLFDENDNKFLVAYLVTKEIDIKVKLLNYLSSKVPTYMIPSIMIPLDKMPMTTNDKIDKQNLPKPNFEDLKNEYVAPRNETDRLLSTIWEHYLDIKNIGIYDDFFSLGGNSIKAIKVISELRKTLNAEVSIKDFFTCNTIALLGDLIVTKKSNGNVSPLVIKKHSSSKAPLSYSQERLWFIDKLEGSINFHIPLLLKINGALDLDLLERSIRKVLERHHVIRTVYIETPSEVYQEKVSTDSFCLEIEKNDIVVDGIVIDKSINDYINKPFNLSTDYMVRAKVICRPGHHYLFALVFHHIAFDGMSIPLFLNELNSNYRQELLGKSLELDELPIQYSDYSHWQRQKIKGDYLNDKQSYWVDKLTGVERIVLPTDFKTLKQQSFKGNTYQLKLEKISSQEVNDFCKRERVTLFNFLLTSFKLLLYRYSNQNDICIGTPITNRDAKELEPLIGFFVNMLPIRTTIDQNQTFLELLNTVKDNLLEAYSNKEVPFEKMVEHIVKNRDRSYSPLFQAMFLLTDSINDELDYSLGETSIEVCSSEHLSTKYDLTFNVVDSSSELILNVEYCSDLFTRETIERISRNFEQLLSSVVLNKDEVIDKISILTKSEENLLLAGSKNDATIPFEGDTIIDLFNNQVNERPNKIAIVFQDQAISFSELDHKSNQLANYLTKKGIERGTLIPVCLDSSIDLLIAILGILKIGAAYVPIDPHYPNARIEYILNDVSAQFVITKETLSKTIRVINNVEPINIDIDWNEIQLEPIVFTNVKIKDDDLIYVIYTSGSTGKPKGVMVKHGGLINRLDWQWRELECTTEDIILHKTTYCFDVSVWELFMPLGWGCQMVICERDSVVSPTLLSELIFKEKVSIMHFVPSALETFSLALFDNDRAIEKLGSLRMVVASGESLSTDLIRKWYDALDVPLYNFYGPTEATIDVTYHKTSIHDELNIIGKPIQNTDLFVLNESKKISPIGAIGELYIGGPQVASGYLNLPELTQERFVENNMKYGSSPKLYKTGDLVRWLPSGDIEYVGRVDHQVKIRGYRIELGEIEHYLLQIENIEQTVVIVKETNGDKFLVSYIVSKEKLQSKTLKEELAKHLPEYMIPSYYVFIDEIPLTPSFKVNRKALLELQVENQMQKTYTSPSNDVEEALVEIWKGFLHVNKISIDDNFFELGGHSLMTVKLIYKLNKEFGLSLPISILFTNPTIQSLAKTIGDFQTDSSKVSRLIPLNSNKTPTSFYCVSDLSGDPLLFTELARYVDNKVSLLGLVSPGLDEFSEPLKSIEDIAANYIEKIIDNDPIGPYNLLGYSFGGKIIFEMTHQLESRGYKVNEIVLIDSLYPDSDVILKDDVKKDYIDYLLYFKEFYNSYFIEANKDELLEFTREDFTGSNNDKVFDEFYENISKRNSLPFSKEQLKRYINVFMINDNIYYKSVEGQLINSTIHLFRAKEASSQGNTISKLRTLLKEDDYGWRNYTNSEVVIHLVAGDHSSIMSKGNLLTIAEQLLKITNPSNSKI